LAALCGHIRITDALLAKEAGIESKDEVLPFSPLPTSFAAQPAPS
jgi:hypothetical protein